MKDILNEEGAMSAQKDNTNIVFFCTATWCGPCRNIKKQIPDLEKQYENVAFFKCDVEEEEFPFQDQVTCMPTFLLYKKHNFVEKIVGANRQNLEEGLNKLIKLNTLGEVEKEVEKEVESKEVDVEKEVDGGEVESKEVENEVEVESNEVENEVDEEVENELRTQVTEVEKRLGELKLKLAKVVEKRLMKKIQEKDNELINSTHTDINNIGEENGGEEEGRDKFTID